MPPSSPQSHPDDAIFDEADNWAGRRPALALCKELFVRVVQLASITMTMIQHLGLNPDGSIPPFGALPSDQPPAPAPAPTPEGKPDTGGGT